MSGCSENLHSRIRRSEVRESLHSRIRMSELWRAVTQWIPSVVTFGSGPLRLFNCQWDLDRWMNNDLWLRFVPEVMWRLGFRECPPIYRGGGHFQKSLSPRERISANSWDSEASLIIRGSKLLCSPKLVSEAAAFNPTFRRKQVRLLSSDFCFLGFLLLLV